MKLLILVAFKLLTIIRNEYNFFYTFPQNFQISRLLKTTHPVWIQYETLQKNRDVLQGFLQQIPEEKIRELPTKGWSIIQALRHIQVSESSSIAYINKKKQAGEELRKRTLKPRIYLHLIDAAFRCGLKFKAPAILRDPEDSSLSELVDDWNESRKNLKELLESFPDEWELKAVYKHPFAGMLNITDAVRFFNIHQNQHIRQVRRIAKHLKK